MRRRLFINLVSIAPFISLKELFWGSLDKKLVLTQAWRKYAKDHCDQNALILYNLLPNRHTNIDGNLFLEIEKDCGFLEDLIVGQRISAIQVTYKLHSISDGAFSTWLNIILGQLIKINPKLFLVELQKHKHLVAINKIICNCGFDLVDDFRGQHDEISLRINAINKVNNKNLQAIKDECIILLREHQESLYSSIFICSH